MPLYINDNHNITLNFDLITKLNQILEGSEIINIKDDKIIIGKLIVMNLEYLSFDIRNPIFSSLASDDINDYRFLSILTITFIRECYFK